LLLANPVHLLVQNRYKGTDEDILALCKKVTAKVKEVKASLNYKDNLIDHEEWLVDDPENWNLVASAKYQHVE
jgi:hypothetical protein